MEIGAPGGEFFLRVFRSAGVNPAPTSTLADGNSLVVATLGRFQWGQVTIMDFW